LITGAILLALCGWAFTFGLGWGNFWVKIGIAVVIINLYALRYQRPEIRVKRRSVLLGLLSAALLYAGFFLGNALSPYVVPEAHAQVGNIYGMGEGNSRIFILLLLLFVTGPGEEIFWRGFLQKKLSEKYGGWTGFLLTTLVYAGVHVFSLNLMLILAAAVAGAFWGLLYLWKEDLALVIVSHSIWSAVIFAVLPIR
jgi:membrane protease YdiL (CAAX protease family)